MIILGEFVLRSLPNLELEILLGITLLVWLVSPLGSGSVEGGSFLSIRANPLQVNA